MGAEKGLFRETLWGELVAWCSHDKEAEGEVVPPEGVGGGGGATV